MKERLSESTNVFALQTEMRQAVTISSVANYSLMEPY